jgi:hypothetical protein
MRARLAALLAGATCLIVSSCASEAPTPTPSPSAAVTRVVELLGDAPAFDPAEAIDYGFVLPGAVAVAADAVHAWVVGFGEARGDQELIHLTSTTGGRDWQVADRRVEEAIGLELLPPGPIPGAVVPAADGGRWVMYFSASPRGGVEGADIWRATASEPGGPWTTDSEPVLARADVPTQDGSVPTQLDFASVMATEQGFLMLFGWSPSRATTLVRSATSSDGLTWTVRAEPAIEPGLCGGFDTRSVAMPRLTPDGEGGWLAVYGGFGEDEDASMALGLAHSTDGISWACASDGPILEFGSIPGSERLHSYAVLSLEGDPPRLLVESLAGGRSELWLGELRTGH